MSDFSYAFLLTSLLTFFAIVLLRDTTKHNGTQGKLFSAFLYFFYSIAALAETSLFIGLFFRQGFEWYDPILITTLANAIISPIALGVYSLCRECIGGGIRFNLLVKLLTTIGILITTAYTVIFLLG